METQSIFPGICIMVAAVILGAAIVYHAQTGRYEFQPNSPPNLIRILDTRTGTISMP